MAPNDMPQIYTIGCVYPTLVQMFYRLFITDSTILIFVQVVNNVDRILDVASLSTIWFTVGSMSDVY